MTSAQTVPSHLTWVTNFKCISQLQVKEGTQFQSMEGQTDGQRESDGQDRIRWTNRLTGLNQRTPLLICWVAFIKLSQKPISAHREAFANLTTIHQIFRFWTLDKGCICEFKVWYIIYHSNAKHGCTMLIEISGHYTALSPLKATTVIGSTAFTTFTHHKGTFTRDATSSATGARHTAARLAARQ